jgi:hypothetical protein
MGLLALRAFCLFVPLLPHTALHFVPLVWGYLHSVRFASSRLLKEVFLKNGYFLEPYPMMTQKYKKVTVW